MSKLIKIDSATENSYQINGFNPAKETKNNSYTSARVNKPVYNQYQASNKPKVFGYYTDWSQYDARLDNPSAGNADRGRGYDLGNVSPTAYDKIIIGFLGIVGDAATQNAEPKNKHNGQTIQKAAALTKTGIDAPSFLDTWGDFQSYRNCGFTTSGWDVDPATVTQENTKGVLGGLRELQKKAKALNHELVLSMSIGGWTMSNLFHQVAASEASRQRFAEGVCTLFQKFPMFSEVDIDWEYPAANGNDNPNSPEDGQNYALLIAELKKQLTAIKREDVKISIASSAVIKTLSGSNIKGLMDAGLHGINVMTYDFFGIPWAEELAHHTNLHALAKGGWGVDTIVDYLVSEGFPSDRINIGYAGYSRNAPSAKIDSFSPLKGSYTCEKKTDDKGNIVGVATGTFESGCSEWYDLIYNYLDLESQKGRNGFNVYTDEVADADYLYNPETQFFMSLDTPRTVREKGRYAVEKNLGALFTWTVDQDNGVLVNAAREGLGYNLVQKTIDMSPFYFKGINVDKSQDQDDDNNQPPVAVIEMGVISGSHIQLSGANSRDEDHDELSYSWAIPAEFKATATDLEIIELTVPAVSEKMTHQITLTVMDTKGAQSTVKAFSLDVYPDLAPTPNPGPTPDPIPTPDPEIPEWDANIAYTTDSGKVAWKGHIYQCKWWTQGDKPDLNCGAYDVWQLIKSS